jgi:hypothetical protein
VSKVFSILPARTRTYVGCTTHPFNLILAPTMHRPHPHLRISLCRCAPPRSSALQQPSEILINHKRDTCAGNHSDNIRGQTSIKPSYAFMRPGVRDCGWDRTVMGAREHRVVLLTFVSCCFFRPPTGGKGDGRLPECVSISLGMGMLRIMPPFSTLQT